MDPTDPPSALHGCRVLDATGVAGSLTGRYLAEMGAQVIKIERPDGSWLRRTGPRVKCGDRLDYGILWLAFNASKMGITLDLREAQGRNIFRRLADKSDLVLESWSPERRDQLGLDYRDLKDTNRRLVWTSVTGYGREGPWASYAATDLVALALGGLLALWGDEDRAPTHAAEPQSFYLASIGAALASTLAIYQASRTGHGQLVDVSTQEMVTAALAGFMTLSPRLEGMEFHRSGARADFLQLKKRIVFECKDGFIVCSGVFGPHTKTLVDLMAADGCAGFLTDENWQLATVSPPLGNQWRVTQTELEAAEQILSNWLRKYTQEELLVIAQANELLICPVLDTAGVMALPHLRERNFFQCLTVGGASISLPGPPATLSRTPWRSATPPPLLGEHNNHVFGELGLTPEEISELKARRVI
jgi:crotonobetainyl-CoA:carnitine CoA-transferase CaiB-like acyl-CoA transferase